MTPSKIFLCFLLSFIGGIFIASFIAVPQLIVYELLVLGLFYTLFFHKEKALVVFALCLIFLSLGLFYVQNYGSPTSIGSNYGSRTSIVRTSIVNKLRGIVYQNLSPPQSSILAAIVLGDKGNISQEWKEKLNIAGVRHITAISGMHIVILSGILVWLGIALGLYRGQAFYFALILLWLFILLTGFQPSAIRAGIMGSLFLFSQKLGRQRAGLNALVLAAGLMLLFNPLLLRDSVGFQLSFLAVLGIFYLRPLFKKLKIPDLLAMCFAAQVFTLPILIYNFGYVSLVSPISNILIVPFLPFIMVSGFVFLIAGLIWQPLAWVLSWLVWLLLSYLTSIVNLFSKIPFASVALKIPWFCLLLFYLILGYLVWRFVRKQQDVCG